ncbi:MAG: ABC transporter permease, partial [Polyangiaceae bacterium]|nr:ABC transporter permease [Polyangiaceae bacterium]
MSALGREGRGRLAALIRKESLQIVRDPSAILIAFVLPVVLLFLIAYAVSLDVKHVRIGLVLESDGPEARSLASAFAATRYFDVTPARDRREVEARLVAGELRGFVVIPQDFDARFASGSRPTLIQTITDGAEPNSASFVAGYADGVLGTWLAGRPGGRTQPARLRLEPRFWFNPEIESRRFLVPGSIAIVMTMIGTMLTALVVAREWERGTMEALLSTPANKLEILVGKLLPYFVLGLVATLGCALLSISVFDVPLRGSWFALLALSCAFLVPALGQG